MTRINVVPPRELSRKHLVIEYRELPRVCGLVRRAQARGLTPADIDAPDDYVLGTGHVKFFYTRLAYIVSRFDAVVREMHARGYHTTYNALPTHDLHPCWFKSYRPTRNAKTINRQRLKERGAT